MISFQTWGERGGKGICVGTCKKEDGDEKEMWGEGRGRGPGMAGDNHSPLGNCRDRTPPRVADALAS